MLCFLDPRLKVVVPITCFEKLRISTGDKTSGKSKKVRPVDKLENETRLRGFLLTKPRNAISNGKYFESSKVNNLVLQRLVL